MHTDTYLLHLYLISVYNICLVLYFGGWNEYVRIMLEGNSLVLFPILVPFEVTCMLFQGAPWYILFVRSIPICDYTLSGVACLIFPVAFSFQGFCLPIISYRAFHVTHLDSNLDLGNAFLFFDNLGCPGQLAHISTNPMGSVHLTLGSFPTRIRVNCWLFTKGCGPKELFVSKRC